MQIKTRAALAALALCATLPQAAATETTVATLRDLYAASGERLRDNPYRRPLFIESEQSRDRLRGEVYAVVPQPLTALRAVFSDAAAWCEVLLLMPNIVDCEPHDSTLSVGMARRFDQTAAQAEQAQFVFESEPPADDYFAAGLSADAGPLGTRDYRIRLQAVAIPEGRSFLRLSYEYAYGWTARMATKAYLSTSGSGKVGFTQTPGGGGAPQYVGGLRGAVERNAMRCYLAVESYLAAADLPARERFAASLNGWLDAIEDYPRQLAENRAAYAAAKQQQHREAQTD